MYLIGIKRNNSKDNALSIVKKSNEKPKNATTSIRGSSILAIIENAKAIVEERLGHLKDEYIVIRNKEILDDYLTIAINLSKQLNKPFEIAIDTETTGLDPIQDKLVGVCLYAPGVKASYIPVNHISYITNERVENQLTEQDIKDSLEILNTINARVIMFNADFDIRVLRNQCNLYLKCYWDCYLAARCLNENEGNNNNRLKPLHAKYVLNGKENEFTFGELFKKITFDKVPIDTAYIYAAHDAIDTYELFKFQEPFLSLEQERDDLRKVAEVFRNIEMPLIDVVANMEDIGVDFDMNYNKELSIKYNALLEEKINAFYDELAKYDELIINYKNTHTNAKLDAKINISSPTQLAILFYDILQVGVIDDKSPRGTGVEILEKIDLPIAKLILEYRAIEKLISTYIDKLPNDVSKKDNRIHCKFNQYGADTGRFSSRDPNLQNIPSHNKDIRKMFKATDGYVLMSSDYSQQENMEYIKVEYWSEVEIPDGWKLAYDIVIGDKLKVKNEHDVCEEITVKKIDTLVNKNQIIYYY